MSDPTPLDGAVVLAALQEIRNLLELLQLGQVKLQNRITWCERQQGNFRYSFIEEPIGFYPVPNSDRGAK